MNYNYDLVAFGGCGLGNKPCANCETEPVEDKSGEEGDPMFCSAECRAEFEGVEDESTAPEKFSESDSAS
ncbi:hypothetical protein [Streptomyces griseosporeus]|uniref:hypothetical protein n=1 Tax=Streptomyces griseosporeus TaxID=1910 RepID=UPI00167DCBAC|nr:hypothetical protein [Streptomyces griseosporeus]GHF92348.1 hypothetical protein GCM10018783_74050 [Streptomyces griseosporeus]